MIAAPAGFVLSASPGVHNGPFGVSGLATLLGIGPASSDPSGDLASASQLHLVSGYQVTYDSSTGMGGIEISLIDLATSSDTDYFRHALGLALGNDSNGVTSADATIPGATDFNATQATKGKGYDHLVVASKANRAMVVNYISGSGASVPLLANLAEQQYERL
jgi:hypothetical protein